MPNKQTEQLIEEAVKEFEANFIEKDYLNPEDGLVIKNEPEEILKYFEASIRTIATKSAEVEQRFEYLVVNHTSWIVEEKDEMNGNWFQDRLDQYGLEGWELCAVDNIHVYFKKALSKPKEKS